MNMDALIKEVYAAGDVRKCGWSRHKPRELVMQPKVHQRPVELPNWVQNVKHDKPPIVHAPCERRPFDADEARARAAEENWILQC